MTDTINTPVGAVKKEYLYVGGGLIVIVIGVGWYRNNKAKKDSVAAAGQAEIDPATGYPFGSAEDAAALRAQAGYISPGGGSAYTGVTQPTPGSFVSNAQWSQWVVDY